MTKTRLILPILFACLPLAACQTVNNGYHSTAKGFHAMTDTVGGWFGGKDKTDNVKQTLDAGDVCPPVSIDADLRELPQYSDATHTDPAHLVSNVRLETAEATCLFNEHSVGVALTITIKGTLGPMGRHMPGEKPSFSYPYILAVMDRNGQAIAEQILSTTFAYDAGNNELTKTERIRQIIPLTDHKASEYKLTLGFEMPQTHEPGMTPPALDPAPTPTPVDSIPDLTDTMPDGTPAPTGVTQ